LVTIADFDKDAIPRPASAGQPGSQLGPHDKLTLTPLRRRRPEPARSALVLAERRRSYGESVNGESIIGNNTPTRYVIEGFADIHPRIADRHVGPDGRFGVEWNSSSSTTLTASASRATSSSIPATPATVVAYDGDWTGHNLVSFFTRANATFKDATCLRRACAPTAPRASAKKIAGARSGGVAGLEGHRRALAQALQRRGDLKLRLSYGMTGNQDLNDNFARFPVRPGRVRRHPRVRADQLRQRAAQVGADKEYNAGFDLGVFGGRVTIIGDWYRRSTDNLLLNGPFRRPAVSPPSRRTSGGSRTRGTS